MIQGIDRSTEAKGDTVTEGFSETLPLWEPLNSLAVRDAMFSVVDRWCWNRAAGYRKEIDSLH
jgi:hypothetical protein